MITFSEFLSLVATRYGLEKGWRMGQTYMNVLHNVRPELYDTISGEGYDPFYNDVFIPVFLQELSELWEKDV